MLIIRPVRHILRGAFFEPSSNKEQFYLCRYVSPLYALRAGDPFNDRVHSHLWSVWEPHFAPLLMDVLAEDIFAEAGSINTLDALYDKDPNLGALLLGGHPDRAADLLCELERKGAMHSWLERQRAHLGSNIDDLCAEFHANEARAANDLKLGDAWEPSRFPVEVPIADRHRCADPAFLPTPWVERPEWLLAATPDRPGDARFAKTLLHRGDDVVLVVPLTYDEAKTRHGYGEPYVVAARLPNGVLMVLNHKAGSDRLDPDRSPDDTGPYRTSVRLALHGSRHTVYLRASEGFDRDGLIHISTCTVHEHAACEVWNSDIIRRDCEIMIKDDRAHPRLVSRRCLTDADLAILTAPLPRCGEFDELVARTLAWLRVTGFGEVT
jgi:hypothetical protein